MALVALPIVFAPELIAVLAGGAAAIASAVLMMQSSLPARMRQYISDHAAEFADNLKREDPAREPTPATRPELFSSTTISNTKVFLKVKAAAKIPVGSVWCPDTLHNNHFEVYASKSAFEKSARLCSVWIDGRVKQWF